MIVNGTNLAELYTQYSAAFRSGFEHVDPQWSKLATVVPSATRENLYSFLGSLPSMREWLGPRQAKKIGQHDYRLVNRKYESTVEISKDDVEDNMAASAAMVFQEMGATAALHPEEIVFGLLNDGAAAGSLCYDGQPFFSASHPNATDSGSPMSNIDTGGSGPNWYLMALNRPLKPLLFQKRRDYSFKSFMDLKDPRVWREDMFEFGVDARVVGGYGMWQGAFRSNDTLDETNLEAYWTQMRRFVDDEGHPMKMARPTHLVVPPELEFDALRLVTQNLRVETSGDGAVDNIHKGRLQVIVSEYLSGT